MKLFSTLAVVLSLGLAAVSFDAEAKRLGGNKSVGMQRQATTQKAPDTPLANTATPAGATAATGAAGAAAAAGKRSWMGPLAGIAAGLGLAALASYLGFGEELATMLLIGLLVVAVLAVVGFIMRKRAAGSAAGQRAGGMNYATAGAPANASAANRAYEVQRPAGSMIGSALGGGATTAAAAPHIPADFDVSAFVRNAKVQFIRLQAANDAGNLDDIRQFTTPEMFAEIKMDFSDRQGAAQQTEVVQLDADVVEVVEEAQRYIVSVRFTGQIREEAGAEAQPFDEVWHLEKPRQGSGGWVLAGIQQMQ